MTRSCFPALCVLFLLLTSCTGYHYVTPLPPVPQFEEAGEVQANAGFGMSHFEAQASVSPVKYLGFTYNLFVGEQKSTIHTYTLQPYIPLGKGTWATKTYLSPSLGYTRGDVANMWAPERSGFKYTYQSDFQSFNFGLTSYGRLNHPAFRLGASLFAYRIRFFSMETGDKKTDKSFTMNLISPMVHVTYSKPLHGNEWIQLLLRFSIGFNSCPGTELWPPRGGAHINPMVASMSVGLNWNSFQNFKKSGSLFPN